MAVGFTAASKDSHHVGRQMNVDPLLNKPTRLMRASSRQKYIEHHFDPIFLWRACCQGKQPKQRTGGGDDVMHVGDSGRPTLAEAAERWGVVGGRVPKTCMEGSDWGRAKQRSSGCSCGLGKGVM